MIRMSSTIFNTLLLALVLSLGWSPQGSALACDQPEAAAAQAEAAREAAAAVRAAADETPPRAPRAGRGTTPPTPPEPPSSAPVPATPAVPSPPPESDLEAPEAPTVILPRGWFGFGLQCDECTAKSGSDESGAVWRFYTLPRVYSVDLGAPAARAGIRRGDLITHINGVSILTPEGGRRFGATRPGELVRWTVSRDGTPRTVVARAEVRPERRERVELKDLREDLSRIIELSNLDQLRRELATLNRQLQRSRLQDAERVRVSALPVRRLRYAGVIGGTEVEVRGPGSVMVSETDGKDELVITTGESVVVIRVSEAVRKATGDKPK